MMTVHTLKKLLLPFFLMASLVSVLFTLVVSATNSITITGGAAGAKYCAYRLLDALLLDGGKYAFSVNTTYTDVIYSASGKSTDTDAINYISGLANESIAGFADAVYTGIRSRSVSADYTTENGTFPSVEPGYYLLIETVGSASDATSVILVSVTGSGNVSVQTKASLPALAQKVMEINDSTGTQRYQDAADYDIGDVIDFRATALLPGNIQSFSSYTLKFYIELSAGLTYTELEYDDNHIEGLRIKYNDRWLYSEQCTASINQNRITVTVTLSKADCAAGANKPITVDYRAELNSGAVIGAGGNASLVHMEYSASPYGSSLATSATDKVAVFTYGLTLSNVDNIGNLLTGAQYQLYKSIAGIYQPVRTVTAGTALVNINGLDAGLYKLVQTTAPTSFTDKISDLIFELRPVLDSDSDSPSLLSMSVRDVNGTVHPSFTTDASGGISLRIVNSKTIVLPATGGIGNTIFYLTGAAMMAAAAILYCVNRKKAHR